MATATATRARAKANQVQAVTAALTKPPLGTLVDEMFELREKKRRLEADTAKLEADYKAKEEILLERMTEEATDKAAGKKAGVSITTGVVADVQDWAKVEAFVKKTGNFQLFQRRISDPAFRELMEKKGNVPGIEPFSKRKVNLRVLGS